MSIEDKKSDEDLYAGVDFDDDESVADELKNAEFVDAKPAEVKIEQTAKESTSKFFNEDKKLIAEKIIEKKSGKIIEIKYNELGGKLLVTEKDKNKKIVKCTDYYENGALKMITDYGVNKSYRSMMYNADGSWHSLVIKHEDGTADATYFDADKKGSNLIVKMDKDKNVIEKRIERK